MHDLNLFLYLRFVLCPSMFSLGEVHSLEENVHAVLAEGGVLLHL